MQQYDQLPKYMQSPGLMFLALGYNLLATCITQPFVNTVGFLLSLPISALCFFLRMLHTPAGSFITEVVQRLFIRSFNVINAVAPMIVVAWIFIQTVLFCCSCRPVAGFVAVIVTAVTTLFLLRLVVRKFVGDN